MSTGASWQDFNNRYLNDAIVWLRLCLERHAPRGSSTTIGWQSVSAQNEPETLWKRVFGGKNPNTGSATSGPIVVQDMGTAKMLPASAQEAQLADKLFTTETGAQLQPGLLLLGQRLRLSTFELKTLLLSVAMELDTSVAGLCARAQDDPSRPYPTFALALSLFDDPAWDALSPERPLRYWRLIEINQPGVQPLTASAFRADERIVNFVKGLNYLDDRLAHLLTPLETEANVALPASQSMHVETIVKRMQSASVPPLPILELIGTDQSSKETVAVEAARQMGMRLYRLPLDAIPSQVAELDSFLRLWHRECLLLPVALYVDAHENDGNAAGDARAAAAQRFLSRTEGMMFLDVRDVWPVSGRGILPVDVQAPTAAEQCSVWQSSLGANSEAAAARLAGQFNLSFPVIHEIAQSALAEFPDDAQSVESSTWEACLRRTRPRMDLLARRLDTHSTWDDIVLPEQEMQLLKQIAAQVGQRSKVYDEWGFRGKISRGLGISALFAGDSGTGKTMAAEVLAHDLGLNLYRIDLSAVVSKYIGETEKNLRRLFDAAEDGGAILFFDEADALFGKRSEVKDSHDRYANIEINYLLQRMEMYRGLAILASNMKSALDTAFMRRLRFIVNFPFPAPAERKMIWQKAFPEKSPVSALDYGRLARLNLTGGSIRNIALNAAFMAAQAGTSLDMATVLTAARTECRKLDVPINEAEFRVKPNIAATA